MSNDQRFRELGQELGILVAQKDAAYGQAIPKAAAMLRILYPEGIPAERYEEASLTWEVLIKLCRINCGNKEAFEENPWRDIGGYALQGMARG
jgi:hypothetical protein